VWSSPETEGPIEEKLGPRAGIAAMSTLQCDEGSHYNPYTTMQVRFSGGKTEKVDFREGAVEDLLKHLGINPVEVIVSRSGTIIPDDTWLFEHDEILITRIVHGG
jgi:sulfur carrier protein